MFKKLLKDESGMAMGLAIITVVLVGVMGAGLLVFVRNDLESVVQVNQGQRAFETADAGIQAAKRQLLSDASEASYDSNTGSNSDWAYVGGPSGPGKNLTFDGNTMNVKIQYLLPSDDPSELTNEDYAPELVPSGEADYPEPKDYFKVTSEGITGEARRKIEAIFVTEDLGVPKSYYTPGNVTITGTADITNVSIFALGDVTLNGGPTIAGTDLAYGDWVNLPFNTTARATDGAGIGALGTINTKVSGRDYDSPEFVETPSDPQGTDEITFPFDHGAQTGQQDEDRLDFLREEAKASGTYYTDSGGVVDVGSDFPWPTGATGKTVVFVEYSGAGGVNRVDWSVGDDSDPPVKGTLVVRGGDFKMTQNKACLQGVVIVRGGVYEEGDSVDAGGNTCLDGFVNATGDIQIKGSVAPIASEAVIKRPGFYRVKQWSWRELYE